MKLTFLYHPVPSTEQLATGVAFYRDELGWSEAWREADDTVAFWTPDRAGQVMVSVSEGPAADQPAGPMYLVDSVDDWLAAHPTVTVGVAKYAIPDGSVVGLEGPSGYAFYVFDQAGG